MGTVYEGQFGCNGDSNEFARVELVRALRRVVEGRIGADASFADRESATLAVLNDAGRSYFMEELQRLSDGYSVELLIDGVLHKRSHDPASGTYHSLCGALRVSRALYREVGVRNGPTVVPLELEAGIAAGATPALAYSLCLGIANETSRQYEEQMRAAHRDVPSRSTIERIGKQIGSEAEARASRIERYVRQSEGVPEGSVAVSIGLDRTSVPFAEEREESQPPKTRRKTRTKPYERQAPPPIDVNFHMAYVATVCFVDADGEPIVTRKYTATHHAGPSGIVARAIADVRAAKLRDPGLAVGLMQDGAPEMWNTMREALDAEPSVDMYFEGIDRYHLDERLGKVLRVTEPTEEARAEMLEQWTGELDKDDGTIDRIREYIRAALAHANDSGDDVSILQDNLTFITNNGDRMRYVSLRAHGLPVGSGATEGACKSLISVRAKRSGQRWGDFGLSAVLTLRAIHQSERLPRFWSHLSRAYTAKVLSAAA